jgi:aspartyl-tRNA(Asn)/glutamyl-tRNA(Gln) amidotransferase subunit C
MKRMPTTAKLTASSRRFNTTNFSARSPLIPALTLTGGAPRIGAVIEREQVLHVAKLARLGLSEEEVGRMAGELSGILEHVDRIAALDLDGVEPTSHVVELENVLRADVPHRSLPPEVALASAPDPAEGAFRVPSPQAEE